LGGSACPVKFLPRSSGRWYWGFKKDSKVYPVKFFEKDSAAYLTGAYLTGVGPVDRTGVESKGYSSGVAPGDSTVKKDD